jgi:large subunit ribosomal protein L3
MLLKVPSGHFFCVQIYNLIMLNTFFAKKVGMTARYSTDGQRWGATIVEIPKMEVVGKRLAEKHGYTATIVKSQVASHRSQIGEVRGEHENEGEIKFEDIIKVGDKVKVSGTSKGHGFTGVVKHYKFAGGPRTHGQSDRERARGSSGSTTTPGRVLRGKRMAGRMGNDTVTVRNLQVLEIDSLTRRLILKGSLPGSRLGLLTITKV